MCGSVAVAVVANSSFEHIDMDRITNSFTSVLVSLTGRAGHVTHCNVLSHSQTINFHLLLLPIICFLNLPVPSLVPHHLFTSLYCVNILASSSALSLSSIGTTLPASPVLGLHHFHCFGYKSQLKFPLRLCFPIRCIN